MWLDDAEYLAFGGCGCRAVAYLGFLRALQERHPAHAAWHAERLKGACGVSSGCLAALAFLVDADATAFMARWAALNVTSVVGSSCFNINGIMQSYGIDDGREVKRIIGEVIAACGLAQDTTFATFAKLTRKDLRVCATNLSRMCVERFSADRTPDVALADAFYWSMCIPFVFMPERFRDDVMVDGCALTYVPVDEWPVERALVLYVAREEGGDGERHAIDDIRGFSTAVLGCCSRSMLRRVDELRAQHPERIVRLHIEDAHKFEGFVHLPPEAFERLAARGYAGAFSRLVPAVARVLGAAVLFRSDLRAAGDPRRRHAAE